MGRFILVWLWGFAVAGCLSNGTWLLWTTDQSNRVAKEGIGWLMFIGILGGIAAFLIGAILTFDEE